MAKKRQETLVLFPELVQITRKFTNEQFGILMRAAFAYRFTGELYDGDDMALEVALQTVANQIDRYAEFCEQQSDRAKKSQKKPEEETEGSQSQPEAAEDSPEEPSTPPIQSGPIQSNPIQSNIDNADEPLCVSSEKKKTKHQYGEYKNVLLTDTEYEKLCQELPNPEELVEDLSEYMASTGKKYKSHYATLRAWHRRQPASKKKPALTMYPEDDLSDILCQNRNLKKI